MKLIALTILLIFVALSPCAAAETPEYVAIASYTNSPEANKTVGARVHAILQARQIESVSAGSAGMTVSVPANRKTEALQLLAKVIKAENLQLTLLGRQGDRFVIVSPDSILKAQQSK